MVPAPGDEPFRLCGLAAAAPGSGHMAALCTLLKAKLLLLVGVFPAASRLRVALSAGLRHCENSWSGLPELIIAFP